MSERSAEEMDRVLAAVRVLWEVCPQVRLGQLVCIVAGGDPFYMEDGRLVEKASELIASGDLVDHVSMEVVCEIAYEWGRRTIKEEGHT